MTGFFGSTVRREHLRARPTLPDEFADLHRSDARFLRGASRRGITSVELSTIAGILLVHSYTILAFGIYRFGGPLRMIAIFGFFSGLMLLTRERGFVLRARIPLPLLLFATWWGVTILWAWQPGAWQLWTKSWIAMTAGAIVIASLVPIRDLLVAFRHGFYLSVFWIFAATIADPFHTMNHINPIFGTIDLPGWHGPYTHKTVMSAHLIFGLSTVLLYERHRWLRWASVAVTIFLVVMAQSATGLSALAFMLLAFLWFHNFHRVERRVGTAMGLVTIVSMLTGLIGSWYFLSALVEAYGKDLTFSGRTTIWSASWNVIRERFWTGYGPGGVWVALSEEPSISILKELDGFIVFHAHNGPLEIMLQLGAIGLGLWAVLYLVTLSEAWKLIRVDPKLSTWVIQYCLMIAILGISESSFTFVWFSTLVLMRVVTQRRMDELGGRRQIVDRLAAARREARRSAARRGVRRGGGRLVP